MKRAPKEALEFLLEQAELIQNTRYRAVARYVLRDEQLRECFGGEKHHHVYAGALLVHTAEVLDWVLAAISGAPISLDADVLRTAVICHDYMKTRDYQKRREQVNMGPITEIDGTCEAAPYKKHIHHVQGGAIEFAHLMRNLVEGSYTQAAEDAVVHCLLSHHGRKEWGSQIEPLTPEAAVLHWADMMSMMFGEGK